MTTPSYMNSKLIIFGLLIFIASTLPANDWPLFRGDQGLTGIASGKLPEKLSLLWKFDAKGPVKASAVIGGGMAFIGGDDNAKRGIKGKLYAINLTNGKKAWEFTCKDPIEAPAMYMDGRVFVGSIDGFLYALDAKTGKELWKFETGDQIIGGPNWTKSSDGKKTYVIVGSHVFFLYCLDMKTGEMIWEYESENYINGSPALTNGRTMFGGCDALLHVIDIGKG